MTLTLAAVVCLIGTSIGVVLGYKANKIVAHDARFCTACHVHDYAQESWKKSPHHEKNTTCHDCHEQSVVDNMKNGLGLVKMLVTGDTNPGMLRHVPRVADHACVRCHVPQEDNFWYDILGPLQEDEIANVPKITRSALHEKHLHSEFERTGRERSDDAPHERMPGDIYNIQCRECHGSDLNRSHQFTPQNKSCLRCHEKDLEISHQKSLVQGVHAKNCLACHASDFLDLKSYYYPTIMEKMPGDSEKTHRIEGR